MAIISNGGYRIYLDLVNLSVEINSVNKINRLYQPSQINTKASLIKVRSLVVRIGESLVSELIFKTCFDFKVENNTER